MTAIDMAILEQQCTESEESILMDTLDDDITDALLAADDDIEDIDDIIDTKGVDY